MIDVMRNKWLQRIAVMLLVFMMFIGCFQFTPIEADDVPVTDTSFYLMASNGSTFLSNALADTSVNVLKGSGLTSSNAGGLLGYSDAADESGIVSGWIASALSYSSATYSYAGLYNLRAGADDATTFDMRRVFWEYSQYGRLLNMLGLDSTGSDSSMVAHGLRWLSGFLMWIAYQAVYSINWAFKGIVAFLELLNPFSLFKPPDATLANASIDYAVDSGNSGIKAMGESIGQVYTWFWNNAGFILGIWLVVLAVSILLGKGDTGGRFKRFLLRAFVLVLGIPLLAATYTQMLGWMNDENLFNTAGDGAAETVLGIYIDFENWAAKSRLSTDYVDVVLEAEVTSTSGTTRVIQPTLSSYMNLSESVLSINKQYGGATSTDVTYLNNLVESVLERYRDSALFTSSDYELYARRSWTYTTIETILENTATTVAKFEESFGTTFGSYNLIWNTSPSGELLTSTSSDWNYSLGNVLDYSDGDGLSIMAMYNYLSTKFEPTSMIVYSNEKASSNFVRESHYSVNMIGSGFGSFMYWLQAWIELIVIALIGWLWCLGMFVNTLKRMIRMCMSLPGAMLGSLKSAAKIVVYSVMGIMEVIATALIFQIGSAMLSGLGDVMFNWSASIITAIDTGTYTAPTLASVVLSGETAAVGTMIAVMLPQIMYVVVCLWVGYMILRLRGSILKSVDEMMTDITNRAFGVSNDKTLPDSNGALGSAIGAGAGAAVAQKLSGGGNDSSGKNVEGGSSQGQIGAAENGGDASAEVEGGGDTAALEAGDSAASGGDDGDVVNLSDNDTASASFNDSGDDEAEAMAAGDSMNSLDGGDTVQGGEMDASDQINDLNDEIRGEVEDGDVDGASEAAGGDSVEDVQEQADMAAADLREKAPDGASDGVGSKQGTQAGKQGHDQKTGDQAGKQGQGQKAGDQAGKQGQGQKAGEKGQDAQGIKSGDAAKSGQGQKTGDHAGKQGQQGGQGSTSGNVAKGGAAAAAAGTVGAKQGAVGATGQGQVSGAGASGQGSGGSDTKVDDRDTNVTLAAGEKQGQGGVGATQGAGAQGQGQQNAVPEGGASATLSDAVSRNADARARLAELEARQGQQGGQAGQQAGAVAAGTQGGAIGAKQDGQSGSGQGQQAVGGMSGQKQAGQGAQPGQVGSGFQQGQQGAAAAGGSLGADQRSGNVGAKQGAGAAGQGQSSQGQQVSGGSQQGTVGGRSQQPGQPGQAGAGQGGQLHSDRQQGTVGASQQGQSQQGGVGSQAGVQGGTAPAGGATIRPDGTQQGSVGGSQAGGQAQGQTASQSVGAGQTQQSGPLHSDRQGGQVGQAVAQGGQAGQPGAAAAGGQSPVGGVASQGGVGSQAGGSVGQAQAGVQPGAVAGGHDMSGGQSHADRQGGTVGQGQQGGASADGHVQSGTQGVGQQAQQGGQTAGGPMADHGVSGQGGIGSRQSGAPEKMGPSAPMGSQSMGQQGTPNGGSAGQDGATLRQGGAAVPQSGSREYGASQQGQSAMPTGVQVTQGSDGQSVRISRDGSGGYGGQAPAGGGVVTEQASAFVAGEKVTETMTTTIRRSGGGAPVQQPVTNKQIAAVAAQAAVATMMAQSGNSFARGMGQMGMMGVTQQIYNGNRGFGAQEVGERGDGFVEMSTTTTVERERFAAGAQSQVEYQDYVQSQIESVDADTAAIEARIRMLEQQQSSQPLAPSRQLEGKPEGHDEYL